MSSCSPWESEEIRSRQQKFYIKGLNIKIQEHGIMVLYLSISGELGGTMAQWLSS